MSAPCPLHGNSEETFASLLGECRSDELLSVYQERLKTEDSICLACCKQCARAINNLQGPRAKYAVHAKFMLMNFIGHETMLWNGDSAVQPMARGTRVYSMEWHQRL